MSFLTDAELEHYTGVKQAAAQIRFLQRWNVRHVVNRIGKPVVTWEAVNGGVSKAPKQRVEPDFEALKEVG